MILAIMASPRKDGNTEILFNEFCRGAEEQGKELDKIILRDYNIKPCQEIYGCLKEGKCPIKDDFNILSAKLEICDALIIFTPVFFYNYPAQMKALIDRCQTFYVRKYMLNNPIPGIRPAYLIAVGGDKREQMFDGLKLTTGVWLDCLNMELKDTLLYREIDKKGEILEHQTAMQNVYDLSGVIDNVL